MMGAHINPVLPFPFIDADSNRLLALVREECPDCLGLDYLVKAGLQSREPNEGRSTVMTKMEKRNLSQPDETRTFDKGKLELVTVGGVTSDEPRFNPVGSGQLA
jgi:hypothetical protein